MKTVNYQQKYSKSSSSGDDIKSKQTIWSLLDPISKIRNALISTTNVLNKEHIPKKITLDSFIQSIKILLNHFYGDHLKNFHESSMKLLKLGCTTYRTKTIGRLNKIFYLEPTIKYRNFSQIEDQILNQCKKNSIITSIQILWYKTIVKLNFQNLKDFQDEYAVFKNFIGQLIYTLFCSFFTQIQKRGIDILEKLIQQTAQFIITDTSQWQSVSEKIKSKLEQIHPDKTVCYNINDLLIINEIIPQNSRENPFQKTIIALKEFINQNKLHEKITLLKRVRSNLQEQITTNQRKLMETNQIKKFKVIQKDDIISCLIHCFSTGRLFNDLHRNLKFFDMLMGQNCSYVLSKWGVDSYKADLQSALQYLLQYQHN